MAGVAVAAVDDGRSPVRDPGWYCHQLLIEEPTNTRSGDHGQATQTWTGIATVWGRMVPVNTSEQQKATGQVALSVFEFHTRYREEFTEKMRGKWLNQGDMVVNFTGIRPGREEDEMVIECAGVKA
jgi:SPP1 family predicted phage head-tail adaptor